MAVIAAAARSKGNWMEPLLVSPGRRNARHGAGWAIAAFAAMAAATFTGCAPKPEQTEIAIQLPAEVERGLELKWEQVKGADSYRMVFRRMTGAPVCTLMVKATKEPSYLIVRDSLPPGLVPGWQLDMEMHAMRKGAPMAATGTRPLKIP